MSARSRRPPPAARRCVSTAALSPRLRNSSARPRESGGPGLHLRMLVVALDSRLRGNERKFLSRRAFSFRPPHVLVEPRQDFYKIAGPVAVIELVHQNFVPGVLAGARRARQAKHVSRVGDAGGGA